MQLSESDDTVVSVSGELNEGCFMGVKMFTAQSVIHALNQVLTIKFAVSLGEGGEQELAGVVDRRQEVSFALAYKRVLHQTGTAGVITRTQTQVLTCRSQHTHTHTNTGITHIIAQILF